MTVKILKSSLLAIPQTSSTMSSRDHPFNRSTRPLLADRKPQLLLKKKNPTLSVDSKPSSVVVHGFNDFDTMSQQYRNINTQHIGYPYGSPPSPTTINANDFVFSDENSISTNGRTFVVSRTSNCSSYRSGYGGVGGVGVGGKLIGSDSDYLYEKPSKFSEFSWQTQHQDPMTNGPFIFGVHSVNSTANRTVINATTKYSSERDIRPVLNQSTSDTSTSSNGTEKDRRLLFKDRKEATKRNRKDKKFSKDKGPNIKCVLVGDGAVGKTNLIVSYLENRFLHEHEPTASDIYNAEVMVNESPVHITLCDTAGQDTLDPLRQLCYPDSDVFLLCFSVVNPETFHSVKTKWAPKFSKTKVSLILVGTQSDLRIDKITLNKLQMRGEKPVSSADAWNFAKSIGAKYIETSSFTQEKVKDVFDEAIWEALLPQHLPPTPPPLWKKLLCLV